jgi:tetratricopeptide (TPR) repeat protein
MITCLPGQVPFSAIQLFTALNNHSSSIIGGNMSEKVALRPTLSGRLLLFLCVFLLVLILILGYSAGWIGLPFYMLTNYQNKNCDSALSLNKVYLALYPRFMQDKTLTAPIEECKQYLSALETEKTGHWREAFDAFQEYSAAHPNGLFSREVHEHSALALMNIVRELVTQEQYEEALTNLNVITSSYRDTSVFAETSTFFSSIYTSWGESLRDSRDFEKAEQVFVEFKSWSQNNDNELEVDAESGLVRTYLAWALDLQSQGKIEDALAKLDLAGSVAPESEEVKTGRRDMFVNWGNDFLQRNELPRAIEKFEAAISMAEGDQDNDARDALANAYIQGAAKLKTAEDFRGALKQLEMAKTSAGTPDMQKSIDSAFEETYLAFSNSSGPQAQRAMKDALKAVCEKKVVPFPIFGLNQEKVRFGIFGTDAQLPEDLRAKTPGELHYIACVDVDEQLLESRGNSYIRGRWKIWLLQRRVKLFWNILLREVDSGEELAKKTFEGSEPPPYPSDVDAIGDGRYSGDPPSMPLITKWLLSAIK